MKIYILNFLIAIDQLFNALLGGKPDHTISGRVGFKASTVGGRWLMAEWFINKLFWLDENHCYNSIEWDEVE